MNIKVSPRPHDLKKTEHSLVIQWEGSKNQVLNLFDLRCACPCANCIDEWTGKPLLKKEGVDTNIKPKRLYSVGQYALGIEWSDGHNTGIYSYTYLNSLKS